MAEENKLRVYFGPEDSRSVALSKVDGAAKSVEIPLRELLRAVGDAVQEQRAWVSDFGDDKVAVSTDLYEVIMAYQQLKRSA